MNTCENLVMRYAENRGRLKKIKSQISNLAGTEIDDKYIMEVFSEYHEYWHEMDGCGEEMRYVNGPWSGWVACMEGHENEDVQKLAVLFDKRSLIIQECGRIKTAIAARGRALLRKH